MLWEGVYMWVNVDIESSPMFQGGLLWDGVYEFVSPTIVIISSLEIEVCPPILIF